ncbi:ligand-dependent nuclear receptor-interacting factor 1 [Carettochelys insculpta]|uniref:ligand-dependent nuclear receptor-interacting factor 1 n=1 Tax=Carettochelys insculpta TaxID=44489 RepID=UPI003EBE27DB
MNLMLLLSGETHPEHVGFTVVEALYWRWREGPAAGSRLNASLGPGLSLRGEVARGRGQRLAPPTGARSRPAPRRAARHEGPRPRPLRSAPEESPRSGSALDRAPLRRGLAGGSRARSAHHVRPAARGAAELRGRARQRRAVIQNEKVCSSETATEIKHKRESSGKQYLELRKRFGLFKEERVYLKRIPLRKPPTGLEASVCSSNNLKKNDFCSASPQGMPVTTRKQNHDKEEKIIVDLEQQDLIKKRKAKLSPVPENGKRRKMAVKSAAINPNMEDNSTSSVILNKSISPTPALLQPKNPPASIRSSLGRDSEQDPCVPDGKVEDTCCPALGSSEGDGSASESSFREDAFPSTPLDLDETVRDEKIKRLKRLLREREAALEEIRKKMQQT